MAEGGTRLSAVSLVTGIGAVKEGRLSAHKLSPVIKNIIGAEVSSSIRPPLPHTLTIYYAAGGKVLHYIARIPASDLTQLEIL